MDTRNEPSTETRLRLVDIFPPHSREEWRQAAEASLQGASFEKSLVSKTYEGIDIQPLYWREEIAGLSWTKEFPGQGTLVRGRRSNGNWPYGWDVSQEFTQSTAEEFNRAAVHDLTRGQTELNIHLDLATRAGKDPDQAAPGLVGACGLSLAHLEDLRRALNGVDLSRTSLYFHVGSSGLPVAAMLFALATERAIPVSQLRGCLEMDPLGSLCLRGKISVSLAAAYREMALLTRYVVDHGSSLQTIGVQGTIFHDGGANAVQELAFALATAVEYVRRMQEAQLTIDQTAAHLRLALSCGSNFFVEIAKLRAARLLWTRVAEAFGGGANSRAVHLHVRTSLWNKSQLDPYTNILRGTSEAFAAVVGGCDSLHVGPFDEVIRVPDEFSRRIARNTQIILNEECGFPRVIDPAGGSYFVEALTDQIAARAWQLFQQVEKMGGMQKALSAGFPQSEIAAMAATRTANLKKRRDNLIGVNLYPNAREKPLPATLPDYEMIFHSRARHIASYRVSAGDAANQSILQALERLLAADDDCLVQRAVEAIAAGATLGEIGRTIRHSAEGQESIVPVVQSRLAMTYEQLRQAVYRWKELGREGPVILQANMGPSRAYRVRADWTTAFFQTGGFEVLADRDFQDAQEVVAALEKSRAAIVVITSSDETYPAAVPAVAQAVKAAYPQCLVLVAGQPGERETAWKSAGVDDFVHIRVGNFEMNEKLLRRLGVL